MLTLPCVRSAWDVGGPAHTLKSCDGGALFEPTQNVSSQIIDKTQSISHSNINDSHTCMHGSHFYLQETHSVNNNQFNSEMIAFSYKSHILTCY